MADGAMQLVVLIAGVFMVPQLMAYLPDFDPLLMIVGLFVILALVQQLGFQINGVDGDRDPQSGRRAGTGGGRSNKQPEEDRAKEAGPKELLDEAARCLEQNSWGKARELARQVTDLDPENARAWELLATAQKWDGKREEAAATVRKARELYELDSEGLRRLAKELDTAQPSGAAVKECQQKGEEFFGRRQYDLAIECFTKALDALGEGGSNAAGTATRLGLLRRRAECAQQLQDWGTCRRDATALLEADPNDARALLQRAASNEALEKFAAALDDARKLLALDPKSSVANRIVHNCQQALRE